MEEEWQSAPTTLYNDFRSVAPTKLIQIQSTVIGLTLNLPLLKYLVVSLLFLPLFFYARGAFASRDMIGLQRLERECERVVSNVRLCVGREVAFGEPLCGCPLPDCAGWVLVRSSSLRCSHLRLSPMQEELSARWVCFFGGHLNKLQTGEQQPW